MGLQLDRDGVVEVLHEGRWLSGRLLHAYRRDDGRWRGIVRYTVAWASSTNRPVTRTTSEGVGGRLTVCRRHVGRRSG